MEITFKMSAAVLEGGFYRFDSKDDYNHFVRTTKEMECAVREGDLDRVKRLCDNGDVVLHKAIDMACEYGHLEIINYFREKGHPLSDHILYFASKKGNLELMRFARENGVEWSREGEETYIAASLGFLEILQYAYENGCRLHSRALSLASRGGHFDCIKYIVQLRKSVDRYDIASILGNLLERNQLEQIKEQMDNDVWWNTFFCKGRIGVLENGAITYFSFDSYRDVSYYASKYPEFGEAIRERKN